MVAGGFQSMAISRSTLAAPSQFAGGSTLAPGARASNSIQDLPGDQGIRIPHLALVLVDKRPAFGLKVLLGLHKPFNSINRFLIAGAEQLARAIQLPNSFQQPDLLWSIRASNISTTTFRCLVGIFLVGSQCSVSTNSRIFFGYGFANPADLVQLIGKEQRALPTSGG